MKKISGKRRTSKSKPPRDIENTTSSDNNTTSTGTGSISGIDSFLHRLNNDVDLNKNKQRRSLLLAKDTRKTSDLDASPPGGTRHSSTSLKTNKKTPKSTTPLLKRFLLSLLTLFLLGLLYDTLTSPPEKRLLASHRINDFLLWVKENPGTGAAAFVFVYGTCVVLLLPGTPLTLGGGYVYKLAYGWAGGVAIATFTSMAGSLVGSCSCFLLGRYVMRDRVRKWGRKYPLFDAVDLAVSEKGFTIMCLLYLTPVLPLGPVSYMCGTTSMPLVRFASAKIAALPLMLVYVFIGASTDTFLGGGTMEQHGVGVVDGGGLDGGKSGKKMGVDEETHRKMVLFGLCLSIVSMSLVSHFVKKELYKIFDKQKKEKAEGDKYHRTDSFNTVEEQVEMGGRTDELLRRPRGHTAERIEAGLQDEEKG